MIRRPPRSTQSRSSAASDVYKRQAMARPEGRIVAISSIAGIRGSGSYGGAKAAVHGWMWWMAGRLAADGITVNCVSPGFVPETDFWQPRIKKDPAVYDDRVAPVSYTH